MVISFCRCFLQLLVSPFFCFLDCCRNLSQSCKILSLLSSCEVYNWSAPESLWFLVVSLTHGTPSGWIFDTLVYIWVDAWYDYSVLDLRLSIVITSSSCNRIINESHQTHWATTIYWMSRAKNIIISEVYTITSLSFSQVIVISQRIVHLKVRGCPYRKLIDFIYIMIGIGIMKTQ